MFLLKNACNISICVSLHVCFLLFALAAFPISKPHLRQMDITQRKMLRRIIGWKREAGEDWHATMTRMQHKMNAAKDLYEWQAWSDAYAKQQ